MQYKLPLFILASIGLLLGTTAHAQCTKFYQNRMMSEIQNTSDLGQTLPDSMGSTESALVSIDLSSTKAEDLLKSTNKGLGGLSCSVTTSSVEALASGPLTGDPSGIPIQVEAHIDITVHISPETPSSTYGFDESADVETKKDIPNEMEILTSE